MKILLINKWVAGATKGEFYYPGTWRDTYELACAFRKLGHKVTILTPKIKEEHLKRFNIEFGDNLRNQKITHIFAQTYIQFNKGFGVFRLRMFIDEIKIYRKFKPDIIQYMQFGPSLIHHFVGNTPIIFYSCDQFGAYPKEKEDIESMIKSWSNKNQLLVIFTNIIFIFLLKLMGSSNLEDALQKGSIFILKHPKGFNNLKKKFKKHLHQIYYIPKAVSPPPPLHIKKYSNTTMIFIGSISFRKGIFDLIQSLKKARLKGLNTIIVGGGPKTIVVKLKKIIKNSGLKINYIGPMNFQKKWILLKKSHFLCLSSYQDSYPSVVLEAMYIGLPVITTNQIDTPVKNDYNGLLVNAGKTEQLKNAIVRLSKDEKMRFKLASNAKKSVINLTWDIQSKKLIKLYQKLLMSK